MTTRPHQMVESKLQVASEDYQCDWCEETIEDETPYMRVALVEHRGTRKNNQPSLVPSAVPEKYHPHCHEELITMIVNNDG